MVQDAGIHPTAIVHPAAQLGTNVSIGAYSVVDENVEIGDGTTIGHHCVVTGHSRLGRDNRLFHGSSIGEAPQDKKYAGEPTRLEIGDRNTIREFCTLNVGTAQDIGVTRIGDDNWIMAYVHVAHDCTVGNNTILANNVTLGGHVDVGDWAILGGMTAVHQFARIGAHSFSGGGTILVQDVPPYVMVQGNPAAPHGINAEGLKRRGFSGEAITAIKRAYRSLYRLGLTFEQAQAQIAEMAPATPELGVLVRFLAEAGRGIVR